MMEMDFHIQILPRKKLFLHINSLKDQLLKEFCRKGSSLLTIYESNEAGGPSANHNNQVSQAWTLSS